MRMRRGLGTDPLPWVARGKRYSDAIGWQRLRVYAELYRAYPLSVHLDPAKEVWRDTHRAASSVLPRKEAIFFGLVSSWCVTVRACLNFKLVSLGTRGA